MIGKYDERASLFMNVCYRVMKTGKVPQHVAFIMDGNRRYAKKESISRKDGHNKGFDKLTEVLQWCYELNIPEVTLYAFSLENFKREAEEVEALMGIFKEKIERLLQEEANIMKHGVCIRFIGDVGRFDHPTQVAMAKVVRMSKDNTKSFLNIAMAYTSRDEITTAIKEIADGVHESLITNSDINEELVEKCFYTSQCRPVDLLIRTSGEVRLSDFLLWQCAFSTLCFLTVLWPELSVWHFFYCVLKYQIQYDTMQNAKELSKLKEKRTQMDTDMRTAYHQLRAQTSYNAQNQSSETMATASQHYTDGRAERTKNFLEHLRDKRTNYFLNLLVDPL